MRSWSNRPSCAIAKRALVPPISPISLRLPIVRILPLAELAIAAPAQATPAAAQGLPSFRPVAGAIPPRKRGGVDGMCQFCGLVRRRFLQALAAGTAAAASVGLPFG